MRHSPDREAIMASGNLRYAVLGLIASKTDGVHGYQLKGECEAIADEFWALNYGRLYRILDELEGMGALTVADEIQKGRPNKKVYRITEKGQKNLDDWLLAPVQPNGQPLRDEMVLKLLFVSDDDVDRIYEIIKQQRSVYLTRLARLTRRRRRLEKAGVSMRATEMILDGAEMRVRADLSWLESIERKLIRRSPISVRR
jgi:DNA-binding PadR family transcriptional regulator